MYFQIGYYKENNMILSIKNFRCWTDVTLKFDRGGVILIKGTSGSGKTALFHAIQWCLYGKKIIRKPCPLDAKNIKVTVTIHTPTIIVERTKNPITFTVIMKNKDERITYEGDIAEQIIEKEIGKHDIWSSFSIIKQHSHNTFMISTNKEKESLLNFVAFNDVDPTEVITKLELKSKETLKEVETCTILCESMFNSLERRLSLHDFSILEEEHISVDTLMKEKSRIEKNNNIADQVEKQRIKALANVLQIEKQLQQLVIPTKYPEDWTKYLSLILRRDTLIKEITLMRQKLTTTPTINEVFTIEDLSIVTKKEAEFNRINEVCRTLGVSQCTNSCVETKISDLISKLENNKIEVLFQRRKKIETELKPLNDSLLAMNREIDTITTRINKHGFANSKVKTDTETNLKREMFSLEARKRELLLSITRSKEIIRCPHCAGAVTYNRNGILVKEVMNDVSGIERDLTEINKTMKDIQIHLDACNDYSTNVVKLMSCNEKYDTINKRKNELEDKLLLIDNVPSTYRSTGISVMLDKDVAKCEVSIDTLKGVRIPEAPLLSAAYIKKKLLEQDMNKELSMKNEELRNVIVNIPEELKKINHSELYAYFEGIRNMKQKISTLTTNKHTFENDLTTMIVPDKIDVTEVDDKIIKSRLYEEKNALYKEIEQEKERYDNEQENKQKKEYTHFICKSLTERAKSIKNNMLISTTNSFNEVLADICSSIFEDSICVRIDPFKLPTTKGAAKKNTISFNVDYKGGTFENTKELSGGEEDRLSVALTLTFHKLISQTVGDGNHHLKLLMFDESLSSLDSDTKHLVLKSIREHMRDSIVLCIVHDGTEGTYDHVIDVNNLE